MTVFPPLLSFRPPQLERKAGRWFICSRKSKAKEDEEEEGEEM
jgi:hypothetical protein